MIKNHTFKILYSFPGILLAALFLSGCEMFLPTATPALPPPRPPAADPFTIRIDGEDGKMVEMAGPSANLFPGSQAGYQLSIFNGSSESWDESYCLVLVDIDGLVALLAEDDFSLAPDMGISTHLQVTFPEDLPPAPYGLSFIIQGRWTTVNTIYVDLGDTREIVAGPWPQVDCP